MTATFSGCERRNGMRLGILLAFTAILSSTTVPAAAAQPARLGTPEVLAGPDGSSSLLAARSAPGHGDAFAVLRQRIGDNVYTVAYVDDRGSLHRFELPATALSFPGAIRLVALEDGGGMVVWDDSGSGRVLARAWTRTGELGPTETVLSGVHTVGRGDTDRPPTNQDDTDHTKWVLQDDGRGTVVVATVGLRPGLPTAVVATVRDPGGGFSPQQRLDPGAGGEETVRELQLSSIAHDGSLTVSWSPVGAFAAGGVARRAGAGHAFGPAEETPFALPAQSMRGGRTLTGADGRTIALSARLAALCPCSQPRVFSWARGEQLLAFQKYDGRSRFTRVWYVAHGDGRGGFDGPVQATVRDSASPVRRSRPGEIGFASFDTDTDKGRFRRRSRLMVVPYGPRVPRSRRAPRIAIGSQAWAVDLNVDVPISCDRVCTVSVRNARGRRLSLRGPVPARAEPFTVVAARAEHRPGVHRITVRVEARDDAGRRSRVEATFRRGSTDREGWRRVRLRRR